MLLDYLNDYARGVAMLWPLDGEGDTPGYADGHRFDAECQGGWHLDYQPVLWHVPGSLERCEAERERQWNARRE